MEASLAGIPEEAAEVILDCLDRSQLLRTSAAAHFLREAMHVDSLWVTRQPWRFGHLFDASATFENSEVCVQSGAIPNRGGSAFDFVLQRARRDAEVRCLLRDLDGDRAQRTVAMRELAGRGEDAIDAVARVRGRLIDISMDHQYQLFSVERQLCDDWASHAWQKLWAGAADCPLEEGALILSQWNDPAGCDPSRVRVELDELADLAKSRLRTKMTHTARDACDAVSYTLFQDRGFGAAEAAGYDDERTFFLSELLCRGLGNPLSLALLFVAVARRVGLKCSVLASIPAQILVCICGMQAQEEDLFLDPLRGGRMVTRDELLAGQLLTPDCLEPSSPAVVYMRMLRKLTGTYDSDDVRRRLVLQAAPYSLEMHLLRLFGALGQLITVTRHACAHAATHSTYARVSRVSLALTLPAVDVGRLDTVLHDVAILQELGTSTWPHAGTVRERLMAARWTALGGEDAAAADAGVVGQQYLL